MRGITFLSSRRGVAAAGLSAHRFFMRAGLAAGGIFAWIFAFQLLLQQTGNVSSAFGKVILLYALSQVTTALVTPFAARALVRGVRRGVLWGTLCAVFALVTWGATLVGLLGAYTSFGVVIFAIFMALYRALYWIPYAVERERVTENSVNPLPMEIFIGFMPLIAGAAMMNDPLGPTSLLFGSASVLLVSLLPLMHIPESHEAFIWGYRQTFGELLDPAHRRIVLLSILDGLQGAALLLVWPIAIFLIAKSSYEVFGLILTATLLIAIPLRLLGAYATRGSALLSATFAASAWLVRIIIATPLGVILVDSYASGAPTRTDLYAFEQGADNGTYIDELTALKEISLALGRLLACGIAAFAVASFSFTTGLTLVFILAALAAVLSVHITRREPRIF